jgi:hypothetical protein
MTSITAAELWRRVARLAGIDAMYGAPFASLDVVPAPDAVALTFAAAHHRVHGARAAAHSGDGVFRLPGDATSPRRIVEVATVDDLVAALPALVAPGEVELRLSLDPSEPVDDALPLPAPADQSWVEPVAEALEALAAAASVVVLAGPAVVRQGAVPGLHDLAVAAGVGVLNTWGAKGVFDWRSRYHLATIGLQADDFVLSGLDQVDLIIVTGLDPAESPEQRWKLAPALTLPPGGLAPFAEGCQPGRRTPSMPPLRALLAGVTQRGWAVETGPLPPSRVTKHYAECLTAGALVAADAGTAGFWVARTLGTTRLGAVIVPSVPWPGYAAACAAVSLIRRPAQPVLAVVDGSTDETAAVIEASLSLGVRVPIEVWDPEGERLDAEAHRRRLHQLIVGGPSAGGSATLATDADQMAEMVDAAGPIIAWT